MIGRELLALINDVDLVWIVVIASLIAFALAWAIGANDVANTFGTSVGAKVLTIKQAMLCAAIFEFLGAFLMGSHVAGTLQEVISVDDPTQFAVGMTAAMAGAWFLVTVATYFSLPVSATHAIIGAEMGFALVAAGMSGVVWEEIGMIVLSWIVSPLLAGVLALVMFWTIRRFILRSDHSFERGLYFMPFCYFFTLAINVFFVVYKGSGGGFIDLSVIPLWGVLIISVGGGYLTGALVYMVLPYLRRRAEYRAESIKILPSDTINDEQGKRYEEDKTSSSLEGETVLSLDDLGVPSAVVKAFVPEEFEKKTEELFSLLQVMTACFGSFAHGANDVANAIGPFAAVISVYTTGEISSGAAIPWWVLAGGGLGIVVGLATWGHRVMATIGSDLCTVTPSRGFNIELASAITVVTGSKLGLPLSTTHCKVGGVVGVGLCDGKAAVNWKLVLQVFAGWIVTLPIAAAVSAVIYAIMWNLCTYTIPA